MALNYEESGVSLKKAHSWVERIKAVIGDGDPKVAKGVGGFCGLYKFSDGELLAGCCDGVGTKLEVARYFGRYKGLGQDLVAMSVNDLVTCGARPLFFLDYIACGTLDEDVFGEILEGVVEACRACDCALLGGETAQMPDVYPPGGFDLAGFAVGSVSPQTLVDGKGVKEGDLLVGLESSGLHSNGYSLVRRLFFGPPRGIERLEKALKEPAADVLLRPTRLYVRQALKAVSTGTVKAMAHITGGGLEENTNRSLPSGMRAEIDFSSWKRPPIFRCIAEAGVEEEEMRRVFNLGIGFVLVVSPEEEGAVRRALEETGEKAIVIGKVASCPR